VHGSRCHWQIGPKTAEETSPNGRPANKIRNFFVIASKERVRGRFLTTCGCLLDLLFSESRNDSWLPNDPPLHAQTDRYQEQRLRIFPKRANIRPRRRQVFPALCSGWQRASYQISSACEKKARPQRKLRHRSSSTRKPDHKSVVPAGSPSGEAGSDNLPAPLYCPSGEKLLPCIAPGLRHPVTVCPTISLLRESRS